MGISKQAVLGAIVVFSVGLLTYYSASRIGFVNNDWYYLEQAARLSLPQYLLQYFDPRLQSGWYRPVFGLLYLVVYTLFGADPVAHHLAHIVLHAANASMLFILIEHISKNLRVALIAGVVYVGLPIYSKAVYWPSVPDPLSMFIYLLAIWFWVGYLETREKRYALFAFLAFLLDVMTKETSITLPIVLFLVDRLLVCGKATYRDLMWRYLPYLVVLPIYLLVEYAIQHNGSYVSMANYGMGWHMVSNLIDGMALVAFPWEWGVPIKYVWLAAVIIIFVTVTALKRSKGLAFLGIFATLNLLPVVAFPPEWFETRYLYISTMSSAILVGYFFETVWTGLSRARWFAAVASVIVVVILLVDQASVNEAVANWGEIARQRRVPLRAIFQNHPTFPPNTSLYFIDTANVPFYDLSVMFLLRYGKNIIIKGATENNIAGLRDHPETYVYYFDESGQPVEVVVDQDAKVLGSLKVPLDFSIPIRLEGFEVLRTNVKHGETLVLLLYWRATQKIDKDYTVFIHMVNEERDVVAIYDGQPRGGNFPTSAWVPNQFVVDPILIPITSQVPAYSKYRLELGLYYAPMMERAQIMDTQGWPVADKITIESFAVAD